jgi:uncharacterized protein (DUF2267 family)
MSATGLDVFDKTLQISNIWLNEIMAQVGPDRRVAWKVLSTVLHKLRDRLPIAVVAHLGAELPLLIRGVFYDQFEPARQPAKCRNLSDFADEVAAWLADTRPVESLDAIRAVFATLSRHITEGQIRKVQGVLPKDICDFWQAIEIAAAPLIEDRQEHITGRHMPHGDGSAGKPIF